MYFYRISNVTLTFYARVPKKNSLDFTQDEFRPFHAFHYVLVNRFVLYTFKICRVQMGVRRLFNYTILLFIGFRFI